MSPPYTTNLCTNPSFETGLDGYTALTGTALDQTSQDALAGQYAMLVTTDGLSAGEGFTGPLVSFPSAVPYGSGTYGSGTYGGSGELGSLQVALSGESGTLLVTAFTPAVGSTPPVALGQAEVSLTLAWQTVVLDSLAAAGSAVYLVVQTPTAQPLTFLADCVQYEPGDVPAHAYIDGSFPGCSWTGAANASSSIQPYEFFQILAGGTAISGSIRAAAYGTAYPVALPAGSSRISGSIATQEISPLDAFTDFAMYPVGTPDPAMTYAGWNTDGLATAATPGYSRPWSIFYPPLDYPVSGGALLWPRAQFMALGFQLNGVPAAATEYLTAAQAEMLPLAGTAGLDETPAPATYDFPRAVHVIVKPTRLNYAPNPNFAVSAAGWQLYGAATVSPSGVATFTNDTDTVALLVPDLIVGDYYTVSLTAVIPDGLADLQLSVSTQANGIPEADGVTNLGAGSFPVQVTFTAPASSVLLFVTPILATAGVSGTDYDTGLYGSGTYGEIFGYPVTAQLSQILIEAGQVAGEYFDGSLGGDYKWEGTPGLSRSYYYETYGPNQVVVNDILTRQVPVSISAADPEYLVTPSQ